MKFAEVKICSSCGFQGNLIDSDVIDWHRMGSIGLRQKRTLHEDPIGSLLFELRVLRAVPPASLRLRARASGSEINGRSFR